MTANRKPRTGGNQDEADSQNHSVQNEDLDQSTGKGKESKLFAAVYDLGDPRALNTSRVIPIQAQILKVGNAILGYRAKPGKFTPLPWVQVIAYQRRNELHRLVSYRMKHGLDIGPAHGWAKVLANLVAAFGNPVTAESVTEMWRWIAGGAYEIDRDIIDLMARDTELARRVWGTYHLLPAREAGAAVALTDVERADCEIRRIDAWTESSVDRRRRLARERKRRERTEKMERKRNDVTLTYNKEEDEG